MLPLLGALFWFIVFSYLLYRIIRRGTVPMTGIEVTAGFGFKILLGCIYGYVFSRYYNGDDTWLLHANERKINPSERMPLSQKIAGGKKKAIIKYQFLFPGNFVVKSLKNQKCPQKIIKFQNTTFT